MDDTTAKIETIVNGSERIKLPITARPSRVWNALSGLFWVVCAGALFALFVLGLMLFPFILVREMPSSPQGILVFLILGVVGLSGSAFFGALFAAGLTCLRDAMRSGPVLEITADGLRDHRSGLSVP